MVNELKDSTVSEETVDAEKIKDAWCGMLTKLWSGDDCFDDSDGGVDGQEDTDVEVLLVPLAVASNGAEWWLGSSTQRALTWKSFCVPSGDGGTHRCSLFFDRQQTTSCFRPAVVIPIFVTVLCVVCQTDSKLLVSSLSGHDSEHRDSSSF